MKYLDKFKNFFKKDTPISLWVKSINPKLNFSIIRNEI